MARLTHLRAWEMNSDGTRAGLAFTARDLDRADPLHGHYATGCVIDQVDDSFTLYGGLLRHELFSAGIPYGFELWSPRRPASQLPSAAPPTRWDYVVIPMARLDESAPCEFDHPDGRTYPAVTFDMHAGHQWGRGPAPVRLAAVGDTEQPAYFTDNDTGTYRYVMGPTTMAPETALRYTDDITHRTPPRKGLS